MRRMPRPRRALTVLLAVGAAVSTATACTRHQPPPGPVDRFAGYTSEVYAQDQNWLCRPGTTAANACTGDAGDRTVIEADGSRHVEPGSTLDQSRPTARYDCFYVYPSVNLGDGTGNNDTAMAADTAAEAFVTRAQFARYAGQCNAYAPLYRQATLSALLSGGDTALQASELAYQDVHDAFKQYMAHDNGGRPIVFVGHSQGSILLTRLLQAEFDNDAGLRGRLISALLIGGTVQVPPGRDVGGSFQNLPLCATATQRSCVITYNTFSTAEPPAADGLFGNGTPDGALVPACVNPARLSGGTDVVNPIMPTFGAEAPAFLQVGAAALPPPEGVGTPWFGLPGAFAVSCRTGENQAYLGIALAGQPGDTRELAPLLEGGVPGWGVHVTETNLTLGDLLAVVRTQAAAAGA
jgi:hypothetical protein